MENLINAINKWLNEDFSWPVFLRISALVLTVIGLMIFAGYQIANEGTSNPCAEDGSLRRCYHISEKMCEILNKKGTETCQEFVKSLALPPGRLTGPIEERCLQAQFDKAFNYSRKVTPECNDLHSDLEDWAKRNMPDER